MIALGFAPEARRDLAEITRYIGSDDPVRAESFVAELEARSVEAAEHPHTFAPRDDLSSGLRAARYGSYLLLFRVLRHEVRIVRIVHSARDLRAIFR